MTEKQKSYKLDLFGKLLPALDKRNFGLYKKLSEEEQKGFADIVALRAMSSAKTNDVDTLEYLIFVLNGVNRHLWNSALSNHNELKCMSLATAGTGTKIDHEFIKAPTGKKRNKKIIDVLKRYYPTANHNELQMFIDINEADDLIEIGKILGMQKEPLNEFKKEIKKAKK